MCLYSRSGTNTPISLPSVHFTNKSFCLFVDFCHSFCPRAFMNLRRFLTLKGGTSQPHRWGTTRVLKSKQPFRDSNPWMSVGCHTQGKPALQTAQKDVVFLSRRVLGRIFTCTSLQLDGYQTVLKLLLLLSSYCRRNFFNLKVKSTPD